MKKTGWFCTYTPVELIHAANVIPYGIRSDSKAEHEDVLLGDSMCSYVRSCMGGALTNVYDDLSGVVIAHSCECMRRLSDGWKFRQNQIKPKLIHILDIPKVVSESSIKFFASSLKRLKNDLEKEYGPISDESIRSSIEKYKITRTLFKEIDDLRKNENTSITGIEIEELVNDYFAIPVEVFNEKLKKFIDSKKDSDSPDSRPRVMIAGGPGNKSLIKTIEESGGLCVAENMCTGLRAFAGTYGEEKDPFDLLARLYLDKTPCPRMLGEKSREKTQELPQLINDYKVDGIIYFSMKFCANMQMDWALLKNHTNLDIPMKVIEGDISSEINEREVYSFIKRLKKRKKKNES
ncbi:MAG: 2-hydroxyacyl-CoA dehydratase [Desulfobacteraceae bacterium]|nr:2-hydroxyacyl-CoA dehydratase [Desulfobacteraceae bacterium]